MRTGGLVGGAWHRVLFGLSACAGAALALGGCTFIIERSGHQCDENADCVTLGLGSVCVDNVCGGSTNTCAVNADCISREGPYHICRKSDHTCQPLQNEQCTTVEGDYANDNAVLFGSVAPTGGGDALTGKTIEDSIKLAIADFKTVGNLPSVPGSPARRPLVLIGCNDGSDSPTAVKAAEHLVHTVGVPAIIGAAFSGITIDMATSTTIPGGVLTISPSATSTLITDLQDDDLVWRTSPNDLLQGAALKTYFPLVELEVRTALSMLPGDKVKVIMFNKGDAYGTGLADALEPNLVINGVPALDPSNVGFYQRFDYGDPDNPTVHPTRFGEAINAALAQKPHIILSFGTTEEVTEILAPVEAQWVASLPTVTYLPRWVLSDGAVVPDLWTTVGSNDALRKRISGSVPGTIGGLFANFKSNYNAAYGSPPSDGTSADVFGGPGGYDATYLIAYATVSLGAQPITGANLAAVLRAGTLGSTSPPTDQINAGKSAINSAFQKLTAGQSIDFEGASGPLNFDLTTGEAQSDIQIWCMPRDNISGVALSAIASDVYYSVATAALVGSTFGVQCNFN